MQEFLAFSDGPVSLEDILKVKGKKFNPSTPELQQRESTEDRERKRATFLMSWEPRKSAEGSVSTHPSIHHFCTHPMEPQLPFEMEILSRTTHAKPGAIKVKTSSRQISHHQIKVRIKSSTVELSSTVGLSTSQDFDFSSESQSPRSYPSLPSRKRKTSSSQHSQSRTPLPSSSVADDASSDDIISMAKARLKKELKDGSIGRSKSPSRRAKDDLLTAPDAKRVMLESGPRRSSLKSRDGQQSSIGTISTSPSKIVKFSGVGDLSNDEMVLTGSRMEVVQDPRRYGVLCSCNN